MSRAIPTVYVALQQFCEWDDRPRRILQEAGFNLKENSLGRRLRKEELPELLRETDAVLAGVEPYGAEVLSALPSLKVISRCGVGTDSIDLAAARKGGVSVFTTAEEVVEPVAQMTLAMILALARNLPLHENDLRNGVWRKQTGFLLSEWTVGLIGFGRIGRAVERTLRPFGPRVLVHDPGVRPEDLPAEASACRLAELLAQADLVSVHAGRDSKEGPILGDREIAQMKKGSRLVNTARGHLVDEPALLQALQSGRLSSAALDVFSEEPYTGPLSQCPNVLCTPHVGTLTRASRSAMELACARAVVEFFS